MVFLVVLTVLTILAASFAYLLRYNEVRRQEWRQRSRAVWIKS